MGETRKHRKAAALRKEAHVHLRFTEKHKKAFEEAAADAGITISEWMTRAALDYLKNQKSL